MVVLVLRGGSVLQAREGADRAPPARLSRTPSARSPPFCAPPLTYREDYEQLARAAALGMRLLARLWRWCCPFHSHCAPASPDLDEPCRGRHTCDFCGISSSSQSIAPRGGKAWTVELVGHHASLPLAFAILSPDSDAFALAQSLSQARPWTPDHRRRRLRGHRDLFFQSRQRSISSCERGLDHEQVSILATFGRLRLWRLTRIQASGVARRGSSTPSFCRPQPIDRLQDVARRVLFHDDISAFPSNHHAELLAAGARETSICDVAGVAST